MKIAVSMLIASALLAGCSHRPPLSSEDQATAILDRHVAAIGGEATYEEIRSLRGGARILEPGMELEADYRAARDGRMRVDIFAGGKRVFSEGIDASGPWQQAGEGQPIGEMSDEGVRRLRLGVTERFRSLANRARSEGSVRPLPEVSVAGETFDAVELTGSDGHVRVYLASRDTGLIAYMREREALHPDGDATKKNEQEHYSDYRNFCGQLHASRTITIDQDSGEELQRTDLVKMECNLTDDALEIARPAL